MRKRILKLTKSKTSRPSTQSARSVRATAPKRETEGESQTLMEPGTEIAPANSPTISTPYDPEHPAAHLREHQFKPGESGNPSGRPKGIFGQTALRLLLRAGKDGQPKLVALIDGMIDKAIRKRDTRAAEFLRDSVDGRPATGEAPTIGGNVGVMIFPPGCEPGWLRRPQVVDAVTVTQPDEPQAGPVSNDSSGTTKKSDCGS